ncbi:rhomboid family intramembrane serine protease [Longibacter salinarum]|uniref:Rhomboid family intramembrane serine protease n=1 Tax=Longibacter salinarum TaxID=1850348 RepID=A0A2A8CWR9_9BACT|nr:rhomboid family intramembrane serine protease [Longibacter salinarum]PEN13073.1 rhomboid family intramembrane serine protease [Longibacter salinarum]
MLDSPITLGLLIINVAISLYALVSDPSLIRDLSFRPRRIEDHGEYYRFFTAGFVHGGMAHLAFNMITLYFFGPLLEGVLGAGAFLILYFGSDLCANALTFAMHRNDPNYGSIGASGAISGVLFAFCLFAPFAKLYVFFAIPMPAILFAILYVVVSVYAIGQREQGAVGGIAHEAHLGGAIGGVLITIALVPTAVNEFIRAIQQAL